MIKLFNVHMPAEVDGPLLQTLHSGRVTQGAKVDEFERMLSEWLAAPHVVTTNSCTSALTLALIVADVQPGDYVITTAMTCTATNLAILAVGAMPVFADVDQYTGLISPDSVHRLIGIGAKAIMAVDWGGASVDTKALMLLATRMGVKLIVDSAHSLGTEHESEPHFRCYSFQAIKFITTGDGGALICRDAEDAKRARRLRWFGIDRDDTSLKSRIDQDITEAGYKFHMNDIAATIGIVQMPFVNSVISRYLHNAAIYNAELSEYFIKPAKSSWLYTILLPNESLRDKFAAYMIAHDIEVSQVHKRNDWYTVFEESAMNGMPMRGLDKFSSQMICLPVHSALSDDELARVIKVANEFVGSQWS